MARYWVFLDNRVSGPFEVDQLIRLRGFSRKTMVCIEDDSSAPQAWISPAEIPELAKIFRDADQALESPPAPAPKSKPAPKASPARPTPRQQAPIPAPAPAPSRRGRWLWLALPLALLAIAAGQWWMWKQRKEWNEEKLQAKHFLEVMPLPPTSLFHSLKEYILAKQIRPKWEFERAQSGLTDVNLSWYAPNTSGPGTVYAFEVNLAAQSVQGLNTAAIKLLAEGFVPPPPPPKTPPTQEERFQAAMQNRRKAFENGDFSSLWDVFSQRKRTEMSTAGISKSGFMHLQSLTRGLEPNTTQTVLKTKKMSDKEELVLLRQHSQGKHGDMFLKQRWVLENGQWKLDEEDKKSAEPEPESPSTPPAAPSAGSPAPPGSSPATVSPTPAPAGNPPASKPSVLSLPGISSN